MAFILYHRFQNVYILQQSQKEEKRITAALYSHKYSRLYETDNDKVRTRVNLLIAMLYYLHEFLFRKYCQK